MRKCYLTDLTDEQWSIIEPLIPPAKHGGRPRTVDMREVINTCLYLNSDRLPVGHAAERPAAQEHGV